MSDRADRQFDYPDLTCDEPHAGVLAGAKFEKLGRSVSREGELCLIVIARSAATKQSSAPCVVLDCFASLAMTMFARLGR
jgi:hypothetical protein